MSAPPKKTLWTPASSSKTLKAALTLLNTLEFLAPLPEKLSAPAPLLRASLQSHTHLTKDSTSFQEAEEVRMTVVAIGPSSIHTNTSKLFRISAEVLPTLDFRPTCRDCTPSHTYGEAPRPPEDTPACSLYEAQSTYRFPPLHDQLARKGLLTAGDLHETLPAAVPVT